MYELFVFLCGHFEPASSLLENYYHATWWQVDIMLEGQQPHNWWQTAMGFSVKTFSEISSQIKVTWLQCHHGYKKSQKLQNNFHVILGFKSAVCFWWRVCYICFFLAQGSDAISQTLKTCKKWVLGPYGIALKAVSLFMSLLMQVSMEYMLQLHVHCMLCIFGYSCKTRNKMEHVIPFFSSSY